MSLPLYAWTVNFDGNLKNQYDKSNLIMYLFVPYDIDIIWVASSTMNYI